MIEAKYVDFNEQFDEEIRKNYEILDQFPHTIRKKEVVYISDLFHYEKNLRGC